MESVTAGDQTKVCPLCAETIKAGAKICPYCQNRQNRWALRSQELLPVVVVFVLIAIPSGLYFLLFHEEPVVGGRSFARHRGELPVVRVALDGPDRRREFWLSGVVTNTGTHAWRVRELEARFLDPQGNLLDVRHPDVQDAFVVEPGRDHAFRVKLGELAWTNPPAVPQVRVQTATDAHSRSQD